MREPASSKSLVDEIMHGLFVVLEDTEEFDTETIERLRHLASTGALKRHRQVRKAIKVDQEVQDETP